jgi:glycosyltransferase involved in cell wall biosynthesis
MRVCHVISGDLWAGAEAMCLRLLSGLCATGGVELSAVLLNEGKLAREIRTLGIPTAVVEEGKEGFPRIVRRVENVLADFGPEILHTHRLKENILGFLASRRPGRKMPLVCTQHGLDEPQARMKWRAMSRINRYVLSRKFDRVVAVSEDIRRVMTRHFGLPERKVVVIHNGTPVGSRAVTGRVQRPFAIGSAGRLFPVKDYPFFVEIAAAIHRQARGIRFELAGDGPEKDNVVKRIEQYGLREAFRLHGFVEDMTSFYEGLDVYLNTSVHEGFPMSVLEAMSHHLPVVAPTEGGIKEVLADEVNGFLVAGRDPQRFAERCLELYRSRELRERVGEAAYGTVVRDFSTARMAEKYRDLYREVLSSREAAVPV